MRILLYMLGAIPWLVAGAGLSAMDRPVVTKEMARNHADARKRMVQTQIRAMGVRDEKVLAAMSKVPRHLFVPEAYRPLAYADGPLPIGQGQTISQPYIVAFMTEALGLSPEDRVLEVGTGSGYQAAVLAEVVREVYTIEIIPELGNSATELLERLGYRNVNVRIGDGYLGWPEKAPFDAIIVTAAAGKIPEPLVAQLKDGGKLCIPVGPTGSVQSLIRIIKRGERVEREDLLPVRFVPLVHPE
jgi:protein-L-isoaspartate(D-aspartate) O-methyltransferase